MTTEKPLKIQDIARTKRVGIVVKSFAHLLKTASLKFYVEDASDLRVCLEEDGTLVDSDYFSYLKPFCALIILKRGESWQGYKNLLFIAMEKLWISSEEAQICQILQQFMLKDKEKKYAIMKRVIDNIQANGEGALEERSAHSSWFEGVEKRFKTKDAVMSESARRRIRHYLFKSKEQLLRFSLAACSKTKVLYIFNQFHTQLKISNFNGSYFSRNTKLPSYCDLEGRFKCQGPFDADSCSSSHTINPYSSKEKRILFSTWNLDHVIERSRQILPELQRAVEKCPRGYRINCMYFYALLFTQENLKLVHIACHRKDIHSQCKCAPSLIYIKCKAATAI